ncbi:hypothetical protein HPB48_017159 [Haemaphysalis longicornis]|uniref:Uncharacterized protein n=1 Tax=Haemaphysalis longicornis TaxID=44386 RepID=A0A9J6GNL5_HAELO|nr:hypothetical protein HPB48_017159 [Haemaphysalis longicornis]
MCDLLRSNLKERGYPASLKSTGYVFGSDVASKCNDLSSAAFEIVMAGLQWHFQKGGANRLFDTELLQ